MLCCGVKGTLLQGKALFVLPTSTWDHTTLLLFTLPPVPKLLGLQMYPIMPGFAYATRAGTLQVSVTAAYPAATSLGTITCNGVCIMNTRRACSQQADLCEEQSLGYWLETVSV